MKVKKKLNLINSTIINNKISANRLYKILLIPNKIIKDHHSCTMKYSSQEIMNNKTVFKFKRSVSFI
jgi:hypothetical protein